MHLAVGKVVGEAMAAAVVKRQGVRISSSWILLRLMNVAFSSFSFDGSLRLAPIGHPFGCCLSFAFSSPQEFRIYRRPFGSLPEVGGLAALCCP